MPVLKVKKNGTWEEVGSSSFVPQSNWNQNDTSALDYIKNRTHYTEIGQDGSETVHKLDEKYLPDGIVKTADLKDYGKFCYNNRQEALRDGVRKRKSDKDASRLI